MTREQQLSPQSVMRSGSRLRPWADRNTNSLRPPRRGMAFCIALALSLPAAAYSLLQAPPNNTQISGAVPPIEEITETMAQNDITDAQVVSPPQIQAKEMSVLSEASNDTEEAITHDIVADMGALEDAAPEQELPASDTPAPNYDGREDGDFQLAAIKIAAKDSDILAWIKSGLVVLEVTGRVETYVASATSGVILEVQAPDTLRTGLRFEAAGRSELHAHVRSLLSSAGVVDQTQRMAVVFTTSGLSEILDLQEKALNALATDDIASEANALTMTLCQTGGRIGLQETKTQLATSIKRVPQGKGCSTTF